MQIGVLFKAKSDVSDMALHTSHIIALFIYSSSYVYV